MRKPKITAPSADDLRLGAGWITLDGKRVPLVTEVRRYEFVTPIFGGGRKAGEPDKDLPVNGKSVRGELRFWWRAIRGVPKEVAPEDRLEALLTEQRRLWGGAGTKENPGAPLITLEVEPLNNTKFGSRIEEPFDDEGKPKFPYWEHLGYVAFPLQPNNQKPKGGAVLKRVRFALKITFADTAKVRTEVEAALWAWETFGGYGARTRRGFGAFTRIDNENEFLCPRSNQVEELVADGLSRYTAGRAWPAHVPNLAQCPFKVVGPFNPGPSGYKGSFSGPEKAWSSVVQRYRKFRQLRRAGSRIDKGTIRETAYGRSEWPEPDAIRRLTGYEYKKSFGTGVKHHVPIHPVNSFPRAAFGLPIIFKFHPYQGADGRLRDHTLDPPVSTLNLKDAERMASPLCFRPLLCENKQGVALVFALNREGESLDKLVLEGSTGGYRVNGSITHAEAAQFPPLKKLALARSNEPFDVVRAFIDSL